VIGKTISHYKILEKLGEGGMGVVYKVQDTKLDRTVALKFMPARALESDADRARFIHEAQAAAALDHPAICTVYEIDEAEGLTFIAMAFVEGRSLKDSIADGPVTPGSVADIAVQVAEGLGEAHAKGIVHRDIKPANIMITTKGQAKILDFGLATSVAWTKLTKAGATLGTVAYMSPEQARGDELDARTDIWSLGVVLYEALAGRLPFEGNYDQAIVYGILNSDPEPITSHRPGIPAEWGRILGRALEKDPARRYQRIDDMLQDLKRLREKVQSGTVQADSAEGERTPSIAVLPFVNMSPDPESEYFGDGLAEELINALAQVEGLKVAARTSAFRFRSKDVDIREIGDKLNVNTVLEGSVRRAGNRVRVTAQLISIADGYHLWSDRYDRELEDIFAIQEEIAFAIVKQLRIKLSTRESIPLVKKYTENIEAYSMFLKGRYYWHKLTAEGWQESLKYFQKAIENDPGYAPAIAWLSVHSQSQAFWGDEVPTELTEKSRALAKSALEIDDTIAVAHSCLAVIHFSFDWDREAAEREFRRSLELAPAEALGHVNYGLYLLILGRSEEGMEHGRLARKLDPFSSIVGAWTGVMPCYVGEHDEAIRLLREALALDPKYWQLHLFLSEAYTHASAFDKAVEAAEKAVVLSGGASIALRNLACALYLAGRVGEGDRVFESLSGRARRSYVSPSAMAMILASRGERAKALEWIQKALDMHDPWVLWQRLCPERIRLDDPRLDALLRRTGEPQ
jgi:TolB-like protein/Tfp pilus assembly protein PilF/predicted Ser/Thr protein kinase